MKNVVLGGVVASIFSTLALSGCHKDPRGPQWDVDAVAPLVHTTFTIADLVADSLLSTDADGGLTLVYNSELFALRLDTVLQAPDTTLSYPYAMPITGNIPAGFAFPANNDVTRFDLEDLELRALRIRSGTLALDIRNENNCVIIGSFALPGATTSQGAPFSIQRSIPAGSTSVPGTVTEVTDLSGYAFDLRGPGFNEVNTLATQLSYQVDPNGPANVSIVAGDSLVALVSYTDIVPAYARGYFGNRLIDIGAESTELDLFGSITSGTLDLDEVTSTLTVTNGIGVDVQVDLDYLKAINSRTNVTVDLMHPIITGPINLNRAIDDGNAPIPSGYSTVLDGSNSNIDLFLENLPDSIAYAGRIRVNPLGDISNGNDFLYYESELKANLQVNVPLRLIATGLTLQQTTRLDLPGSPDGHAIQSGVLHLFATNGFPFSAAIVLEILNDADQVVGTIPVQGSVASGILGANDLVTASVNSQLDALVSADLMDLLYSAGRLRISTVFNTADQSQHLQLLDSYRMELQVTVEANYVVNGDE